MLCSQTLLVIWRREKAKRRFNDELEWCVTLLKDDKTLFVYLPTSLVFA